MEHLPISKTQVLKLLSIKIMKTITRIGFFIIFCLIVSQTQASLPVDTTFRAMKDTSAFKVKLKNFSSSFNSMQCSFTQRKCMKMLKKPVVSNGLFAYKKGNMVRWEYTNPFVYIIIINGTKIMIKDEAHSNQFDMTANAQFLEMNTKLASMVDGSLLDDHTDFAVKYFENDLFYKVEMKPVSEQYSGYFLKIVVTFEKTDLSVSGIKMFETGGDLTDITFSEKQINKPISDERFIIK